MITSEEQWLRWAEQAHELADEIEEWTAETAWDSEVRELATRALDMAGYPPGGLCASAKRAAIGVAADASSRNGGGRARCVLQVFYEDGGTGTCEFEVCTERGFEEGDEAFV